MQLWRVEASICSQRRLSLLNAPSVHETSPYANQRRGGDEQHCTFPFSAAAGPWIRPSHVLTRPYRGDMLATQAFLDGESHGQLGAPARAGGERRPESVGKEGGSVWPRWLLSGLKGRRAFQLRRAAGSRLQDAARIRSRATFRLMSSSTATLCKWRGTEALLRAKQTAQHTPSVNLHITCARLRQEQDVGPACARAHASTARRGDAAARWA